MAQIVQDFAFEIHFGAVALAELIQLVYHVAQVRADLLHFFVTLTDAVGDHGFALAWVFKLHAFGEELALILMEVDLQDIVVRFLAQTLTVDFIRIGYAKTLKVVVHSDPPGEIITFR